MRRMTGRTAAALCVLAASGCAAVGGEGSGGAATSERVAAHAAAAGSASVPVDAIARDVVDDFLHALAQLDGHAPEEATVRFSRERLAADPFVASLERAMRERGYAVRLVGAARAARGDVRHAAEPDGEGVVHTLLVDDVRLRRRYVTAPDGSVRPAGPLFVLGADASGLDTDRVRRPAARAVVAASLVNEIPRSHLGVVDFD